MDRYYVVRLDYGPGPNKAGYVYSVMPFVLTQNVKKATKLTYEDACEQANQIRERSSQFPDEYLNEIRKKGYSGNVYVEPV